ncbi:MAG TPA: alpha/beta hydrolase [Candidatus Dormibacteraeota bacterium]|jgi:pimeloyl-ACP methyl ester carboxylesterase
MNSLELAAPRAFLRYADFPGAGTPLICLHGLGAASTTDFPLVVSRPALAARRSVLVDFFGHGLSDAPADFAYSIAEHAGSIAALMDGLGLRGCAAVGHSMGGAVAITLAATRPDLVSRLVLAEPNLGPGGGAFSRRLAAASTAEELGAALDWMTGIGMVTRVATFRIAAPFGLQRSAASLVEGTAPTWREMLCALTIPRAFLIGERSLPDPDVEVLAACGLKVLVVPASGHDMTYDNPDGFAAQIALALDA